MEVNIYNKSDRIIETSICENATKVRFAKNINIYLDFFLSEISFKLEDIKPKIIQVNFNGLTSVSEIG